MLIKSSKVQNIVIILSFLFLPVCALCCLCIGRYSLSFMEVVKAIFSSTITDDIARTVVINIRLPRVLLSLFCGAGLSAAGLAFQTLFSNPLATPDTVGVASGASFGAVLAMFFGFNLVVIQFSALIFGMAACFITWSLGQKRGQTNIVMLVLSGIMVSAMFQALLSVLKYLADPENQLPSITYWLLGSMASVTYKNLLVVVPFMIAGLVLLWCFKWKLNLLTLSEEESKSLGLKTNLIRFLIVLAASMIIASCVSACGQIGWVGLLIPHLCRMLVGNNTKKVLPLSIGLGASFLLIIDTVARTLTAAEIPVSIITALIGAPLFVALLRKSGGDL